MHRPLLVLLCLTASLAATEPARIRAVADQAGPAVITVRTVAALKIAIMGQNRSVDHTGDSLGVVVDPSGLTVVGLIDLDSGALMKSLLGGNPMIQIDSELKEVSLRLDDGSEVAAEIVVKDAELGLAIIRPKEAGRTFPALVPASGTKLQTGDHVLLLSRAPRYAASALMIDDIMINGTVGGPQPYALVRQTQAATAAICDGDGRLLGLTCAKEAPAPPAKTAEGMDPLMSITSGLEAKDRMPVPIIRPADAIAKLLAQAKAKK